MCFAHKYSVEPTSGLTTLPAILNPGNVTSEQQFTFTPPSILVNEETHQEIINHPGGEVEGRLRDLLSDATRELCRRTLEQQLAQQQISFDFRTDPHNCDGAPYSSE